MSEVKPYVGISGVVSPEQQRLYEGAFAESGLSDSGRRLALGIKAVHKTQFLDIENKYGSAWYPVGEVAFQGAVEKSHDSQKSINIAQAYLDVEYVGDPDYRKQFTDRIFHRGGAWIDGIQFDMLPWHSNRDIATFLEDTKTTYPDKLLLLQCHGGAMEQLGPKSSIRKLGKIATFVDYVLFDSSHGTGRRLDTGNLRRFLDEGYSSESLETVGLAIAGGLNADVVREDLPEIVNAFPEISWDAEGQLHPSDSAGNRPLNETIVRKYLYASQEVLKAR